MGIEIERRFLLTNTDFIQSLPKKKMVQAYLSLDKERTVRIRMADGLATLTIKGYISALSRPEFEYPIPLRDAEAILASGLCVAKIIKTRHYLQQGEFCWEIDLFEGENLGLSLAEIELPTEDTPFERPDWLGDEVSFDGRYSNAYLAANPFSTWKIHQK
jgi:CYTH domain-containing protein